MRTTIQKMILYSKTGFQMFVLKKNLLYKNKSDSDSVGRVKFEFKIYIQDYYFYVYYVILLIYERKLIIYA